MTRVTPRGTDSKKEEGICGKPAMRRYQGQRAYPRPIMITEYQERFCPPRCYTAQVLGAKIKHSYQQQLKAKKTNKEDTRTRPSSGEANQRTQEIPSLGSFYMTQNWVNHPSKLPPVTTPIPMSPKKCCCAQFCPVCSKCAKDDNLTIYKGDYQEWNLSKRQPYRLHDNLKVFQGIGAADLDGKERQPIDAMTSYRSSFVRHPVQPRMKQDTAGSQTSSFTLAHMAPARCGHCTEPCRGMVNNFNSWTLETKLPRSAGPDSKNNVDGFHSTMHTDFIEHKLQRTKPIIPARQSTERSKEPLETITTMRDDYRRWDLPRRSATGAKKDWRKSADHISLARNAHEGGHCKRCHQRRKDSDAGNGTGEFGTTGYRPMSTNGAATWMDTGKDQSQMVSCMVSTRN